MDLNKVAEQTDEAETLTVKELRDAMCRVLPDLFDDFDDTEALTLADDVLRNIKVYRERKWRTKDVVRDAEDTVWQRSAGSNWYKTGSSRVYPHTRPKRPLELLCSPADEHDSLRRCQAMERARDDGMPA